MSSKQTITKNLKKGNGIITLPVLDAGNYDVNFDYVDGSSSTIHYTQNIPLTINKGNVSITFLDLNSDGTGTIKSDNSQKVKYIVQCTDDGITNNGVKGSLSFKFRGNGNTYYKSVSFNNTPTATIQYINETHIDWSQVHTKGNQYQTFILTITFSSPNYNTAISESITVNHIGDYYTYGDSSGDMIIYNGDGLDELPIDSWDNLENPVSNLQLLFKIREQQLGGDWTTINTIFRSPTEKSWSHSLGLSDLLSKGLIKPNVKYEYIIASGKTYSELQFHCTPGVFTYDPTETVSLASAPMVASNDLSSAEPIISFGEYGIQDVDNSFIYYLYKTGADPYFEFKLIDSDMTDDELNSCNINLSLTNNEQQVVLEATDKNVTNNNLNVKIPIINDILTGIGVTSDDLTLNGILFVDTVYGSYKYNIKLKLKE